MTTKPINLFDFNEDVKSNIENNSKLDDDFADFGEFVTPVTTKTEPENSINKIDLLDMDSVQLISTNEKFVPVKPQNDIDSFFSIPSNQHSSNNQDLFSIFSNNSVPTMIQNSFTMPNISLTSHNLNQSMAKINNNSAPTNSNESLKKNSNSNSIWDKLGQSVDINLDNLTPHSKGLNNKSNQNNIPLKDLIVQGIQSPKSIANPPLSPNSSQNYQLNSNKDVNLFDL